MKFKDPKEQELNLGHLFTTAVMAEVPIFGDKSFNNKEVADTLRATVKKAIHADGDPVIDLLDPANEDNVAARSDGAEIIKLQNLQISAKASEDEGKGPASEAILSSREQHDRDHYASYRPNPASKEIHEMLDNIMLQRALDGYLFNCQKNQSLLEQDPWLQDAWDWIGGTRAAFLYLNDANTS